MRYAMIMAGGSGTRLWPMSRARQPKQLIPFINGRSLLQIAMQRLSGLVPAERIYVCAGLSHREAILANLKDLSPQRYLGEPVGRDTLNAVGLAAAERVEQDPDAIIAVFTADHIIEPEDRFRAIVKQGFEIVEKHPEALVTFGIAPTHAATGYGYLQLGRKMDGAFVVDQFKEKPPAEQAEAYHRAGPDKYLWNSGMFVWRASTLLDCIRRFAPKNHAGLSELGKAWLDSGRDAALNRIYPQLPKVSVDYGVMEPASKDPAVKVVAVPMPLTWLDVGSWPSFAKTCETDAEGNARGGGRHLLIDSKNMLVASSDADHLIATIGCDNLIVIHTPDATLVCPAEHAEKIKQLHEKIGKTFGNELL